MTRKRTSENDLVVSTGVRRKSPARSRKHTPVAEEVQVSEEANGEDSPVTELLPAAAAAYAPTHEEIAQLAYLYWESRGGETGSPDEDWLRAEQELRSRPAVIA